MYKDNKAGNIDLNIINQKLTDCPDIIRKKVYIDSNTEAYFFYIQGIVNNDLVQRDFIKPVLELGYEKLLKKHEINNLPCKDIVMVYETQAVIDNIMMGNSVFLSPKLPYAVICQLIDVEKRPMVEPLTEKNIKGSHEGFIENLQTNLALLRRKIRNENLKFKSVTLGKQTKQMVVVAYIEGIANQKMVNDLYNSISNIQLDGFPAISYIEQLIVSHKSSIFPQFQSTERTDITMASLLEGRIVIMDDSPIALIAPVSFSTFFQSTDDYSTNWIQGSFLRFIRIISAIIIAILLPAIYIAITSFHYFAVPLSLIIPLAESRSKVPFPPIIEVLMLEIVIEMIREASVRLPTYVGTSISVVAGLIIGQAAVEAGVVSNLLIVIVAVTVLASYTIPHFDMALAIRLLRLFFITFAALFGAAGIVVCIGVTFAHLVTIDSLGKPYIYPFSPLNWKDMKDVFIRAPYNIMTTRPEITKTPNKTRLKP